MGPSVLGRVELDTCTYSCSVLLSCWLTPVLNQVSNILNITSASLSFLFLMDNRGRVTPYLLVTEKKKMRQCSASQTLVFINEIPSYSYLEILLKCRI